MKKRTVILWVSLAMCLVLMLGACAKGATPSPAPDVTQTPGSTAQLSATPTPSLTPAETTSAPATPTPSDETADPATPTPDQATQDPTGTTPPNGATPVPPAATPTPPSGGNGGGSGDNGGGTAATPPPAPGGNGGGGSGGGSTTAPSTNLALPTPRPGQVITFDPFKLSEKPTKFLADNGLTAAYSKVATDLLLHKTTLKAADYGISATGLTQCVQMFANYNFFRNIIKGDTMAKIAAANGNYTPGYGMDAAAQKTYIERGVNAFNGWSFKYIKGQPNQLDLILAVHISLTNENMLGLSGYDDKVFYSAYDAIVYGAYACYSIAEAEAFLLTQCGVEAFVTVDHYAADNSATYPNRGNGHGWVMIRLDGVYYWADPAAEKNKSCDANGGVAFVLINHAAFKSTGWVSNDNYYADFAPLTRTTPAQPTNTKFQGATSAVFVDAVIFRGPGQPSGIFDGLPQYMADFNTQTHMVTYRTRTGQRVTVSTVSPYTKKTRGVSDLSGFGH